MITSVSEYIDSFIYDTNDGINWKYLKSSRKLKKQIGDIIFEINFYSSKYNDANLHIEVRSECRVWYRKYDKSHTIKSAIANIPLLENRKYWWDITDNKNRDTILQLLKSEISAKVIHYSSEMETDFNHGLLHLIYNYGFSAYCNSIQLIDELLGREEALKAANAYSKAFTPAEQNVIKRFMNGENALVNERNLRYILENRLI